MKLICSKDKLNYAVQTVQKAIAVKNPLPILTGVYMQAENNKLTLEATDYEIGIRCTIDAEVEVPGKVVLSGRYFQEITKKLPGETVKIASSQEDRTVEISSNMSKFNLLNMPAEEFPVLRPISGCSELKESKEEVKGIPESITIEDVVLKELIKKTVFACANEENKPIYTGALLENTLEDIRMIATNTHRLAFKKFFHSDGDGDSDNGNEDKSITNSDIDDFIAGKEPNKLCRLIIPAKVLNELARLLVSELPLEVKICWEKNKVSFTFDDVYFESRLIEGVYPDYKKVIPEKFSTVATIDTLFFYNAVERASLMVKEGDYNIIKFAFNGRNVVITSNNPNIGKTYEEVPLEMEGDEIEIAFNAKYIIDILKNISSEKLTFSLNTPISPASIKPVDDNEYIYVITPVRTI